MFFKIFVGTIFIAAGLLLSGWAVMGKTLPGEQTSEVRPVSGFSRIELHGAGKVILTQGSEESLVVEAGANLLPYIKTEVRGDTLHLDIRAPWLVFLGPTGPITYRISAQDVAGMGISGSGSFEVEKLKSDRLETSISGSGTISVADLQAEELQVSISGSGTTRLAGLVESQSLSISGSGRLLHDSLESRSVKVRIAGSGRAEVWAADSLDVSVSGSGTVIYQGSPALSQSVSGVANIRQK